MNHCLESIRTDHHSLTEKELTHVQVCEQCRTEYNLMQKMEKAIQSVPDSPVPLSLKNIVMQRVIVPVYKMWHVVAVLIVAIASPALFSYLARVLKVTDEYLVLTTVLLYAILVPLLILPLTNMVFRKYRNRVESFSGSVDAYLEERSRKH